MTDPTTTPGLLQGIRVLDFSRVFAGPAATQMLGDLGADVIKIEDPGTGDDARYYGVGSVDNGLGASAPFLALNRNKRSVGIDLRSAAGQEVVTRLAAGADVVLHNFRPGVMARWKLDYDDLVKVRPAIVYCEFSAYGSAGPLSHVGANDVALQAHSGLMSITGEPGREPVRSGTSVVDLHGGLAMVAGILGALYHRERTGKGQRVRSSLLLSSADLMNYFYTEYWIDGTIRAPMGSANHLTVPNQAFPAADGRVVIIASTDDMWLRAARELDAATLDIPAFATSQARRENREQLVAAVSAVTSRLPSAEIVERLGRARVVVAKVNSIGEAADHPQLAANNAIVEFPVGNRTVRGVGGPFQLEATPAQVDRPPPRLAAHTDEVLSEFGFAESEVADLRTRGAFG